MGLLDDTVRDARRPLPGAWTLHRSAPPGASAPAPDDTPEPADESALTVYRLQKDGGSLPPPASPGPPPSDDASLSAGRPEGTAAVTRGALRPDRTGSVGLATGQDPTSELPSDVSGAWARRVPADTGHPRDGAARLEAGAVSAFSNARRGPVDDRSDPDRGAPTAGQRHALATGQPSEGDRAASSRHEAFQVRSREDGTDAPSGDLFGAPAPAGPGTPRESLPPPDPRVPPQAPVVSPADAPLGSLHADLQRAAQATRLRVADRARYDAPNPTPDLARSVDIGHGAPLTVGTGPNASPRRPGEGPGQPPPGPAQPGPAAAPRQRAEAPAAAGRGRPGEAASRAQRMPDGPAAVVPGTAPVRLTGPEPGPRLSIGRIEVVVLAPAAPTVVTGMPVADSAAFLSRHYLRRL